jgi:hypothetical protein
MRKLAVLIAVLLMVAMTVGVSSAAAPVADPDCPASYENLLEENDFAHVAVIFSTLRYTPDGAAKEVLFAPTELAVFDDVTTITDNPGIHQFPCVTNTRWAYVQDTTTLSKGWVLLSEINGFWGSAYWIAEGTVPVPETPTSCSNAPAFGLTPGGTGEIAQVFSTLREFPGGPGTQINSPAAFNVLDPLVDDPALFDGYTQPTCAGGLAFWRIDYGGTIGGGWASEGQGSTYWLSPTTAPAAAAG